MSRRARPNQFLILIVAVLLAAFALAACGSDDEGKSDSGTSSSSSTSDSSDSSGTSSTSSTDEGTSSTSDAVAGEVFIQVIGQELKNQGLDPELAGCVEGQLRATLTPEEIPDIKAGTPPESVRTKLEKAAATCLASHPAK